MTERLQAWGDTVVISISSCLVFDTQGRLLLLQRHREDLGGGEWGAPGGRIESEESPRAAVIREVGEETGLDASPASQLGTHLVKMPHGAVRMTSFTMTVPTASRVVLRPDEQESYAWFEKHELLKNDAILWGIPSILRDFGLFDDFGADPTLADGSQVILEHKA